MSSQRILVINKMADITDMQQNCQMTMTQFEQVINLIKEDKAERKLLMSLLEKLKLLPKEVMLPRVFAMPLFTRGAISRDDLFDPDVKSEYLRIKLNAMIENQCNFVQNLKIGEINWIQEHSIN